MIAASGEELFLRPADDRHRNYVLSTCVRETSLLLMRNGLRKKQVEKAAEFIAKTLIDHVWVVTTEQSPSTAHGWICAVNGTLLFVYVPHELRKQGIAKHMMKEVCG